MAIKKNVRIKYSSVRMYRIVCTCVFLFFMLTEEKIKTHKYLDA